MQRPITEFVVNDAPEKRRGPVPMRIDADLADAIHEIAHKCLISDATVLSRIVRDALPYVKLTERKVYEMEEAREE